MFCIAYENASIYRAKVKRNSSLLEYQLIGKQMMKYKMATQPNTKNGLKVVLEIMVPAFVNSMNPMTDVSAVALTAWTIKPTVGAIEIFSACGPMTNLNWSIK